MPYLHDACRTRTVKDILSFAKPKLTLKIPNIKVTFVFSAKNVN